MNITFCCTGSEIEPWLRGLRAALPDATVELWQPGAAPADHAVVWMPPQQFFDEQQGLRTIFNIGAGVDALMRLRLPAGATVVRLEDAGMAVQMAEFVTHAVVRYFRGLEAYATNQRAGLWEYRPAMLRSDCSIGVMGLGQLGERVAQTLAQFEFPVRGWSRSPKTLAGVQCFAAAEQLPSFLAGTRVLVNLLPLTPDTENILCRANLAQLLPGGYVINVARGAHLVDDDLLALLDSGHLAGAALDVFRTEPLPAEHPFWGRPEIALTPHTSARTLREDSIAQIAGKIRSIERGEPIAGIVDSSRGY